MPVKSNPQKIEHRFPLFIMKPVSMNQMLEQKKNFSKLAGEEII